jgi:hypothetical protein
MVKTIDMRMIIVFINGAHIDGGNAHLALAVGGALAGRR